MANRFWVGGTGTWDGADTSHWSTATGGAGGASVPTSSDVVYFDSGSSGSSYTCTLGATVNASHIECGSVSPIVVTLDATGNPMQIGSFGSSGAATINLGNQTHILSGNDTTSLGGFTWILGLNVILNAGTSTIKMTDTTSSVVTFTFGSSAGKTYNNVWFSRGASTGDIKIVSPNVFNDLKDDGSAAHSIIFTAGKTQTFTTFTVSGSAGNLITINSSTTGTHSLVKSGGGTISCDYLNIQHSVATPAFTWYAGTHSVNNQSDATAGSGWIFTAPTGIKTWDGLVIQSSKVLIGSSANSVKTINGLA